MRFAASRRKPARIYAHFVSYLVQFSGHPLLDFDGVSMGFLLDSWDFHVVSMVFLWDYYGFLKRMSMVFLWDSYGVQKNVYGISIGFLSGF